MHDDEPESVPSEARENALFLAAVALGVLLGHACALIPIVASLLVSPWLGLAAAVGMFWVWTQIGPPPMPGLLSGMVCLWGYWAIFVSLVVCLVLAVRSMLN